MKLYLLSLNFGLIIFFAISMLSNIFVYYTNILAWRENKDKFKTPKYDCRIHIYVLSILLTSYYFLINY